MVPMERLSLKEDVGYDGEDAKADALLHHLELYKRKGTAVALEAKSVGGYLTTILEESYAPGEDYNGKERPVA